MNQWPVQLAKVKFSEFLGACTKDGPQLVTRRGMPAAVLVSIEDWKRMQAISRPTLKTMLLTDQEPNGLLIPERGATKRRKSSAAK